MKSILFGFVLVLLQASCVPAVEVDTRVIALRNDNKYYPGVVQQYDRDRSVTTVRFDDQPTTATYQGSAMSEVIIDRATRFLHKGAHVIAKKNDQASHWNIGFVTGVVGSGTARRFRVLIDGDAGPKIYSNSQLRHLPNPIPDSVQTVGARVIARGPRVIGDSYYRGFVVDAEGSSLSIRLDNGNTVDHAKSDTAAVIRDELPSPTALTDDRHVIAALQPDGDEYVPAVIRARRSSSKPKFIVRFDNHEGEPESEIRNYYHIRLVPGQ
ncbi:uncharacterized protein LOC144644471 [Oculina patagonica]